jgi:hypothetical protein
MVRGVRRQQLQKQEHHTAITGENDCAVVRACQHAAFRVESTEEPVFLETGREQQCSSVIAHHNTQWQAPEKAQNVQHERTVLATRREKGNERFREAAVDGGWHSIKYGDESSQFKV